MFHREPAAMETLAAARPKIARFFIILSLFLRFIVYVAII